MPYSSIDLDQDVEVEMAEGPELRFLLTCGRLYLGTARDEEALTLLNLPLSWAHLLEKADEEGMSGILAFQLRRLAQAHNVDLLLAPLTQAFHHIFARNGALFAELSALREALRRRGLQAILLKGGALIGTVYRGHLGLRPLSDLDLLIKARDLPFISEVLKKQGFHPLSPSSTFFLNGWAAIDLHTDLIGTARIRRRRLAFRFDEQTLWREASPLYPDDPTLLVLSSPHQFLHLAVHALKHPFSPLIWFVDLGLVFQRMRWEELLEQAKATGTLRPLAYALFGLKGLMRVEIPQEVLACLPLLNLLERRFLRGVVRRKAMGRLGEVLVAFSIPGLMAKMSYLFELGLPRREVLAEVFPSTPSWFLYPRRLLQAMALGFQEGRNFVAPVKRRNGR